MVWSVKGFTSYEIACCTGHLQDYTVGYGGVYFKVSVRGEFVQECCTIMEDLSGLYFGINWDHSDFKESDEEIKNI